MKLLDWIHRKIRQHSSDVFKDFAGGGTCCCVSGHPSLEDDYNNSRRRPDTFPARSFYLPSDDVYDVGAGTGDGYQTREELWGGFLTIGTMGVGSDPIKEEEAASDVSIPTVVEAIAEKEAEATTETDLMLVTAELEKVLAAEAEKSVAAGATADGISSPRPSHVGTGGPTALCPLQGFLFGSAIELAATAGQRERRASLGELFMRSNIASEATKNGKEEATEKFARKGGHDKTTIARKQTMMNRMMRHRGTKGSDGPAALAEGLKIETKLYKILHIFHKKVHPESNHMTKNRLKSSKNETNGYMPVAAVDGRRFVARNDTLATSKGASIKENTSRFTSCSHLPSFASINSNSNGRREHWIKTDAEYVVLEL